MPIRVTCQCGQSLNVPDTMAGKSGKCPKCQQVLTIPKATGVTPKTTAVAGAKLPQSATNKPQTQAAPSGNLPAITGAANLDSLFDQAGLKYRAGNFCPSCDAVVPNGAVLCVKCGLHFGEGNKLEAHQVETKREFGNKQLNDAVVMMSREAETQNRLLASGTPWWFMLAALAGIVVFLAGALIKMDSITSGQISSNPLLGRIQKADMIDVLAMSLGMACLMICNLSVIAMLVTAYKESAKQGLLCMFAPFYLLYYMFSRIKSRQLFATVIIYWITAIIAIACLVYALPRI